MFIWIGGSRTTLKIILDELFGENRFQNEIVWQRHDPHNDSISRYGRVHDLLFWYSTTEKPIYNYREITESLSEAALAEYRLAVTEKGEIMDWYEGN
jgi:adenine-specific DNA-methyltransferase